MSSKTRVAGLSVFSNSFLIILKLITGVLTGSVSIISEAIHSAMDLLAAVIAFFAVKISDSPPDSSHPYGHGKFENVSGVIESLLIIVASVWIIYEALQKLFEHQAVEQPFWGVAVMFVSAGVNFFVSGKLYQVAKKTDSVALEADALHLKTDVLTSAGVGIGLLLLWITGMQWLDPAIAIFVALFILKEAYLLIKKAFNPLMDVSLAKDQLIVVEEILKQFPYPIHDLKTRKSGSNIFIEFHLEMPGSYSFEKVHQTCDAIEDAIKARFSTAQIMIHAEPV